MSSSVPHISVCICTYKRPQFLARLLAKLEEQESEGLFTYSAVVVDNDPQESGREVVAGAQASVSFRLEYQVEPERNISLARNRSVANAHGDLIAFIDDDEFPDASWLLNHFRLLSSSGADGVLGPVIPHFDGPSPAWLVKSGLVDRKRFSSGHVIADSRYTRTGNVLIRKRLFDEPDGSFDPEYGVSGGGDAVFFRRMMEKGRTFVWCDEARVFETVPPERQTRSYHIKRAFTRGMTTAWESSFFSMSTARSVVAVAVYTLCLPFCLLGGQHLFMRYLVKDCDHLGKLLAHVGIRVVRERPYKESKSEDSSDG